MRNKSCLERVLDAEKKSCVNNLKQKITHSYLKDQWFHVFLRSSVLIQESILTVNVYKILQNYTKSFKTRTK